MRASLRELYAAMLERDLDGVREISRRWIANGEASELYTAVSRFTALAFNPSQHGRHALLAAIAAAELREPLGERWGALITECAVYAAEGRLPWSEAPILEPPAVDGESRGNDLSEALRNGDLASAEKWLAARLDSPHLAEDFFNAARLAPGEAPLVTAVACWKLSLAQDAHPSWAALRPAVVEWSSAPRGAAAGAPTETAAEIAKRVVAENGSIVALHDLLELDAQMEAERLVAGGQPVAIRLPEGSDPVYPLARDFAAFLLAHPAAVRLAASSGEVDAAAILASCRYNLERSSWEEWSFG